MAVADTPLGMIEDRYLSVKSADCTIDIRLVLRCACIVDEITGGKIVTAVDH